MLLPRGQLSSVEYNVETASTPRKKRTKDPLLHPEIPSRPSRGPNRLFASTKKPTRGERYDNFIPCRKIWKNNERNVEILLYLTALCMPSINRSILSAHVPQTPRISISRIFMYTIYEMHYFCVK